MKLFVVSDIHGYAELLKSALESAGYCPTCEDHLLICCGDLFDRGVENYSVLEYIESLERKILIKGNHEERLQKILKTKKIELHDVMNGTFDTICELFGEQSAKNLYVPVDFSGRPDMFFRLSSFLEQTQDYYETEHYIFLHGWLPNENNMIISDWRKASEFQWHQSRRTWWIKGCQMLGNNQNKTIVCGHYPTVDSEIFYGNGFIAIDAGTDTRKSINVLVLEDNLIR